MLTFSILKHRLLPCYWNYPHAMKPLKWAWWAQKQCLCLLPEGGRRKLKWNQCTLEMNGYMLTSPVRRSQLMFCRTAEALTYFLVWSSEFIGEKLGKKRDALQKGGGGTADPLPRERIPNPQSGTTSGFTSRWVVPTPSQPCLQMCWMLLFPPLSPSLLCILECQVSHACTNFPALSFSVSNSVW